MNGILKYRRMALALIVVFGVFNVGIPVLIATCSMPEMMRGDRCPMCEDRDYPVSPSLTTAQTSTCCTTVIVAGRNTSEFVQAKGHSQYSVLPAVLIPHLIGEISRPSSVSFLSPVSPSPPAVVDIPILNSTLLI